MRAWRVTTCLWWGVSAVRKLLNANFARLWRSWVFWLAFFGMLALSVFSMFGGCRRYALDQMLGRGASLDYYYFELMPVLGLFSAVFTGLFLGTEYADGAMRNKLVVGHSRTNIYFANLITCSISSLLFLAALLLGGLVGIPTFGLWKMAPEELACYLLLAVLSALAISAVFTAVGMAFSSNRAVGAVIAILLFLGLMYCASMVYSSLSQPEMYSGMHITAEGLQVGDPEPNPSYIGGTVRTVYEFLLDLLPTGQGMQMANLEAANPLRMALCSAGIFAAAALCGGLLFHRKDLK